MAISGLVVTLNPDPDAADLAVAALRGDRRVTVGERHGGRLAVTLETDSPRADRAALQWLLERPGVDHADVVFVHLDDLEESA